MNKFYVKEELGENELKEFFSENGEYEIEKIGENKFKIIYEETMENIIYKPTLQTLIRKIQAIAYLEGYEAKELELKR